CGGRRVRWESGGCRYANRLRVTAPRGRKSGLTLPEVQFLRLMAAAGITAGKKCNFMSPPGRSWSGARNHLCQQSLELCRRGIPAIGLLDAPPTSQTKRCRLGRLREQVQNGVGKVSRIVSKQQVAIVHNINALRADPRRNHRPRERHGLEHLEARATANSQRGD